MIARLENMFSHASYAPLAFAFLSPLLLWGVALASIPVILHLLHKRKYQEVEWAAMRFLMQASQKNSRRIRLEQLLLLVVRVLMLALLAFALAQPFFESSNTTQSTNQPTQRIIVIDTSYSMGQQTGEFTLLDKAKKIANQIVETTQSGDTLQLVRISATEPNAVVQKPARKSDQVFNQIEQLKLTEEWGDIPATLQTVTEMIQTKNNLPRTEVYWISDFQRESWLPTSSVQQQRIRSQMQQLSESANLVLVDLGSSFTPNVAVTHLTLREQLLSTRQPVQLQTTIRNDGPRKINNLKVELYLDGRIWKTETVDLEPGVPLPIDFQVTFDKPGEHFAEIRLPKDLLAIDNHRFLALPVREELRLLLVNGRPAGEPRDTATFFLNKALSPSTREETWSGFTRPLVISEAELAGADLSLFDCVILCDIAQLTKRETDMLEAYAKSGGSVIFTLGQNVKADQYNELLFRFGKGILPAQLASNVGNINRPLKGFRFDPLDLSHPIVKPFQGNPGTGFEATLTYRYTKTKLLPNSQTKVALRFTNGDAAILDATYGRGRVLLVTTAVDSQWGLWSVQRSFPPLMHEMVKHAVAGRWQNRQSLVNQTLTQTLVTNSSYLDAKVITPGNITESIPINSNGRSPGISFNQTKQSGIYRLKLGAPFNQTKLFAVNVNPRESQLEKITEKEIRQTLLVDQQFHYMTSWQQLPDIIGVSNRHTGGITRWLLMAVVCLLLIEQLMAWRFYWGFLMLYATVAACFVAQVLSHNLYAGIAATLLFSCGFVLLLLHPRREEGF